MHSLYYALTENVNEGLDRAVMSMKKGEQAIITICAEYLSSREVTQIVPANSVLCYDVKLLDFTKVFYFLSQQVSTISMLKRVS